MEETEFEPIAIKGMDKCAIIYRSDPVSFIYVCYHCGTTFTTIDSCLQHIESHFQLVQVTIPENRLKTEFKDSEKSSNSDLDIDNNCDITEDITDAELDIKTEVMESEDCGGESLEKPSTFDCKVCDSVFSSKFSFRSHTLKEHLKEQALECEKCGKTFKRDAAFKNHLRQHIERGEVDWNCEGDGIREPSSIVESLEQQDNSVPLMQVEKKEIKTEKRQAKKKSRTTQVKSKQTTLQKSTYVCHKCSKTYTTANDLNEHLKSHSTSEMLHLNKCKKCETFFQSAFDLRLHVLEIHLSVKKFKCSTCLVEFKQAEKLLFEKHLKSHLENSSEKLTSLCHGICSNGKDASSYEEITTSSELSCESCEEKFYLKSNLDEHVRCMHSDNEHKLRCPQCESVFPKLKWYFAHQLEHRRVGATVTETDINVLITNLNSYIDEQFTCNEAASNSYKCLICYTERNSLHEIRLHIRERHVYKTLPQPLKPSVKERISCNICGMVITRTSFRTHFLSHTDKKSYPCSICGKIFSKKYSKTTHERMHTGEKPFQCDQCGKRFFSSSLLGAHKQSHDSKTYPCKICGRVFNISSGYRRHVETHRKDQSFECTICLKSFKTRVYLTRHVHKHNEKKFQCSICENKFHTAKGLQRHNESRHNHEGL